MPFTDPMADGPTIQAAGRRALLAGASLAGVLELVREFRAGNAATPLVLMGYLNPILSYGVARFCADAAAAGVDGLIVVDLPTEEADLLLPLAAEHRLDVIRLVAPTTSDERLPLVLAGSSGFVYYVSITGITGTRTASAEDLARDIPRLRRATDLPIAVGFGVRTPEQAALVAAHADGAIVASVLIDKLFACKNVETVLADVAALSAGIKGVVKQDA
jgi:tryptophan synthase alpha chain